MILKQVELKEAKVKALASLDKSMRLTLDVNITPENEIDIAAVHNFLYKPLCLEIREDV